ncbi:hypothetical protein AMTRI_Chr07g76670 [Amborella trichopoda]
MSQNPLKFPATSSDSGQISPLSQQNQPENPTRKSTEEVERTSVHEAKRRKLFPAAVQTFQAKVCKKLDERESGSQGNPQNPTGFSFSFDTSISPTVESTPKFGFFKELGLGSSGIACSVFGSRKEEEDENRAEELAIVNDSSSNEGDQEIEESEESEG